jgi:hypothetical protein
MVVQGLLFFLFQGFRMALLAILWRVLLERLFIPIFRFHQYGMIYWF